MAPMWGFSVLRVCYEVGAWLLKLLRSKVTVTVTLQRFCLTFLGTPSRIGTGP